MSYCRQEGKDQIIFLTEEDYDKPTDSPIPDLGDLEDEPGLILENGEINWNCPCLGGMATGPCGNEFRDAFSCFHYSEADPKGSDCIDNFRTMQGCMMEYPTLYDNDKEEEPTGNDLAEQELGKVTEMANSDKESLESSQGTSAQDNAEVKS